MKTVKCVTFNTTEQLRGAIIRRYISGSQADTVIFVGPKAIAAMKENSEVAMVTGDGVWKNWPRVKAIRSDGHFLQFKKTDDGDEMFFYELDS